MERKTETPKQAQGAEERITNNYEKVCRNWQKNFLAQDHEELIRRFDLKHDDGALYLTFYTKEYRIDRRTGIITETADPEKSPGFDTLMSIYHLFYYSRPGASVKGEFVPFRLVKRASPFAPAFLRTVIQPLSRAFDGHAELLKKSCEALKGRPVPQGDVGYILDAFFCVPVMMVFWDGDDEFEAQANILFDADITDFLHEETVCLIGSELVRRLIGEADLESAKVLLGSMI